MIGVKPLDFFNKPVFSLPDAPLLKYSSHLEILKDTGELVREFPRNQSIWWIDRVTNNFASSNDALGGGGTDDDKYFGYTDILVNPGSYRFKFSIKDGDREVASSTHLLIADAGPATDFEIVFEDENDKLRLFKIDEPLLNFNIHFKDSLGYVAKPPDIVSFSISCPGVKVMYADKADSKKYRPHWKFKVFLFSFCSCCIFYIYNKCTADGGSTDIRI